MTYCCDKCFNDAFLIGLIKNNRVVGNCDYCGRTSQTVIISNNLKEYFQRFFDIYELEQEGVHYYMDIPRGAIYGEDYIGPTIITECHPLHILLQEDWSIFSKTISESVQAELLTDILKDYPIPYFKWGFSSSMNFGRFYENKIYYKDKQDIWSRFSKEIKCENRFFMQNSLHTDIVDLIKQKEIFVDENDRFNRARIGYKEDKQGNKIIPYDKDKMGMPPADPVMAEQIQKVFLTYTLLPM